MEKSEYIKIQEKAWEFIERISDDASECKSLALEALKMLSSLKIAVDDGKNVLLYQQAKTLLGIAVCLVTLDDSLDALKILDELERLEPSLLTPCKDKLNRLKAAGRELRKEVFG